MATIFGAVNLVHKYAPRAVLSAAVLATTYPVWPPRVAVVQVQTPTALAYDLSWAPPTLPPLNAAVTDNAFAWNPREVASVTATIGFHNQNLVYNPAKRSTDLLSGWDWPPAVQATPGTAVVTEMWYQPWETPPDAPKPRLSGNVAWPGVGYLFTQVQTAANIEWASEFPEPPKRAQSSVQLLGDDFIWAARPPLTEYQDGWRSAFSTPQRLSPQPRLAGNVAWPGIGFSIVQVQTPTAMFEGRWQRQPGVRPRSQALRDAYSLDWTFHGGSTVTPAPVKSSILFVLDNAITCSVEDVNFNIIVASSTINPDLDP